MSTPWNSYTTSFCFLRQGLIVIQAGFEFSITLLSQSLKCCAEIIIVSHTSGLEFLLHDHAKRSLLRKIHNFTCYKFRVRRFGKSFCIHNSQLKQGILCCAWVSHTDIQKCYSKPQGRLNSYVRRIILTF